MSASYRIPALFAAVLAIAPVSTSAQNISRIYYVDFDNGSDNAPGTSQNAAWKHAPGDPQATDMPSRASLMPGDTIMFRAGIVYRGTIQARSSIDPSRPLTYTGQGWGNGRAILSGRDAFNVTPQACKSLPACAKLPNADQLIVIDLPVPVTSTSQIVLDGHILQLTESPPPAEPFWFDNVDGYTKAPPEDLVALGDGKTWQIQSDFINQKLDGDEIEDLFLFIQGYPNLVSTGPAVAYNQRTSTIQFQPGNFTRNQNREVQFALANHPRLIAQPFEYATIAHGAKLIVRAPMNSVKLEIARRQSTFIAVGQKNLVIKGFEIQGYAGGPNEWRGGVALVADGSSNVTFDANDVHDLVSWVGSGAIGGGSIEGLTVTNNRFLNLPHGSGVRVAKVTNGRILNNEFDSIGRTGILIQDSDHVVLDRNILQHLHGTHGNGISIYRDNHDIVVSNNLVADATRAVTIEGNGKSPPTPNNIVFRANLLQGVGRYGIGLQSWGGHLFGVVLERNVILVDPSQWALGLSGGDANVIVRQNILDGYQGRPMPLSSDTKIEENIFVSTNHSGPTDGNDVKSGLRDAAVALLSGKEDPRVCKFLMASADTGSGIGPANICRAH